MNLFFCQKTVFSLLLGTAMLSSALASVQLKVDADKRVSVPIAADSMNRIAFANDRISQVFGDEEAYTMQSDEARGQLFLKPTEANGDKPISITVTTEQGVIQDLELLPQKIATRTIVLKEGARKSQGADSSQTASGFGVPLADPFKGNAYSPPLMNEAFKTEGGDYATQLVHVIKCAAAQRQTQSSGDEDVPTPLTLAHLTVEGVTVVRQQGWLVSVYKLTNITDQTVEITENAFSGKQVLAIAFEKRTLPSKETGFLYLVQKA